MVLPDLQGSDGASGLKAGHCQLSYGESLILFAGSLTIAGKERLDAGIS